MRRIRRHAAVGLFVAALISSARALAVDVPTIYDNAQSLPVGSRAAGMAGAYTALACDEGALQYNVAALGCASASRLELAANAYLIQGLSVPDAFGGGNDVDTVNFHTVPAIAAGVRILDPGNFRGVGRWVFGFSVAVPHSIVLDADPSEPTRPSFLAVSVLDNVTTLDVGSGWRPSRFVAVGVGLGGGLRIRNARFELLSTGTQPVPCGLGQGCQEFFQRTVDEDAMALGIHAKIGVRVTPTRNLSLGLMVTTPSIDVWGTSSLVDTSSFAFAEEGGQATFGSAPFRFEGSSSLGRPLRIAIGAAYVAGPVTLSIDGSLNFPHRVGTLEDLEQLVVRGGEQLAASDVAAIEEINEHDWQPNLSVGGEWQVSETVALAGGAFTDLSSVSQSMVDSGQDRVHLFGGSLGLGLLGERARGWFGAAFEVGQGTSQTLPGGLDLQALSTNGLEFTSRSTLTRWNLSGFVGSTYSFFRND